MEAYGWKDKCDTRGCPARWMVQVMCPGDGDEILELQFCGHHYHGSEPALVSQGFIICVDNREGLSVKQESSAGS